MHQRKEIDQKVVVVIQRFLLMPLSTFCCGIYDHLPHPLQMQLTCTDTETVNDVFIISVHLFIRLSGKSVQGAPLHSSILSLTILIKIRSDVQK